MGITSESEKISDSMVQHLIQETGNENYSLTIQGESSVLANIEPVLRYY